MGKLQSFKELVVWQRSMELVEAVYRESSRLPTSETYGLTSQLRRAAISIPSNIAEGSKRGTARDYVQFLRVASGSAAELETQLMLAVRLYPSVSYTQALELLTEVQKMLSSLISSLTRAAR